MPSTCGHRLSIAMKILQSVQLLLLLALGVTSYGQVSISFNPGPSQGLSLEELWSIKLINQSPNAVKVYLLGDIQLDQQQVYNAKSKALILPPGVTQLSIGNFPGIEVLLLDNVSQKTHRSGVYRLCVEIFAIAANKQSLSKACKELLIVGPQPPKLVFPFDDDIVTVNFPTFSWLPPAPIKPGNIVTYTIRVTEEASSSNLNGQGVGPLFFTKENIPSNSLAYPTAARPFNSQKTYKWQIEAYSRGVSLGKSEVWTFRFGQPSAKRATIVGSAFVKPQSRLGAGYCYARESLRFYFECPYGEALKQKICIRNQKGELVPFERELLEDAGLHQFILPLPASQGWKDQTYYILEVKDNKGEKKILRFKYIKV